MPQAVRLSLQFADGAHRALLTRHRVLRCVAAAVETPAEITVRIVGEDEGRALNRSYRGKDYATNVLTFAYQPEPQLAADLVLCAPVVEREAQDGGLDLLSHYVHLLVHGCLHARGYDHEQGDLEAARMETLESQILLRLGYPDPYAR